MLNTNCLAGVACPACGQEDEFAITVTVQVLMQDEGTVEVPWKRDGELEYDDLSPAQCPVCDHGGLVGEFTTRGEGEGA